MIRHLAKRAVALFALFSVIAAGVQAGQPRNVVPSRVKKAEAGDWVLIRFEDRMTLETITSTEEVEDDFLVHYTMQDIAFDGTAQPARNVVRLLSDETAENLELQASPGAKVDKKRGRVDGKNLNIVAVIVPE
jgi:hypothetical protein